MIKLISDKHKVNGPRIDGSYTLTFEVGEYEVDKIAEVMKMQGNLEITIDKYQDKK